MNAPPSKSAPQTCFVIGPIGQTGSETRKHADMMLHAVIKHVVEDKEFNFICKRADEDARPGMINDQIIYDIVNSDVVIADLSELNPNAFYELGIRHSTLKPTIHIASQPTKLPFDNAGHSTLFVDLSDWHSIISARSKLSAALKETLKEGYKVSNPLTQAKATFAIRSSKDPKDIMMLGLQNEVEELKQIIGNINYNKTNTTPSMNKSSPEYDDIADRVINIIRDYVSKGRGIDFSIDRAKRYAQRAGMSIKTIKHDKNYITIETDDGIYMADI